MTTRTYCTPPRTMRSNSLVFCARSRNGKGGCDMPPQDDALAANRF
jgi:hypothetical protein